VSHSVAHLEAAARWSPRSTILRLATLFVVAIFVGEGIAHLVFGATAWTLEDMDAYWEAAMRLRTGEPLYGATDVNAADVFRYAPWFAMAWMPLTLLPRVVVEVGWSVVLVAASVAATLPALRSRRPAAITLAALLGPFLVWTASRGNVHPLLIAGLVYGMPRPSAPLWVAAAASLKATPIAFGLALLGDRRWRAVILAIVLTAVLTLPAFAFGIEAYTLDPGGSQSLMFLGWGVWAAAAAAAVLAAVVLAVRRSDFTIVAAAVAVMALLPRFFLYDLTYLLVVTAAAPARRGE
jgi:hypothetical protein